jgi:hypothetical protein
VVPREEIEEFSIALHAAASKANYKMESGATTCSGAKKIKWYFLREGR